MGVGVMECGGEGVHECGSYGVMEYESAIIYH
jgi:hypothetical protein